MKKLQTNFTVKIIFNYNKKKDFLYPFNLRFIGNDHNYSIDGQELFNFTFIVKPFCDCTYLLFNRV